MTTQTNQARFLRRFLQKAARRRLVSLRMKETDKLQFMKIFMFMCCDLFFLFCFLNAEKAAQEGSEKGGRVNDNDLHRESLLSFV